MISTTDPAIIKQKVDELTGLAWNIRVNEIEKALQYSNEALELSREIDYLKGQADAFRIIGFAHIRKSDFSKAKPYLEEAFQIYDSLKDLQGLAVIHQYIGIIHRNTGNCKSALERMYKALELCRDSNFWDIEITTLYQLGVTYRQLGDYNRALEYLFESILKSKSSTFTIMEAYNLNVIGSIYFETGDYKEALNYFTQGLPIRQQAGDFWGEAGSLDNIGHTYMKLHQYEEALTHCKRSLDITKKIGDKKGQGNSLLHLAEIYHVKQEGDLAAQYAQKSLKIRKSSSDIRGEAEVLLFLAGLLTNAHSNKLEYLSKAASIAESVNADDLLNKVRLGLYTFYKNTGKFEEALTQLELHTALEAELNKNRVAQKMANLEISHKAKEARIETETIRNKNNELIRLNRDLEEQKERVQRAMTELEMAQTQLIHTEKMASLGQLTAGIAHEIQNPLNFVNNFSEVSVEMLEEIQEKIFAICPAPNNDDLNETVVREIFRDIKQNLEKISLHGKRADAIVKGMLEHSKSNSGEKAPTDINALADEYLRLSYYGMRAKDKTFNADYKTELDATLPKVYIVPQDIGRVLLNIINNAFQACGNAEFRNRNSNFRSQVNVSTKNLGDKIQISVQDNGPGVPAPIKEKIFQPFFTTKPPGQGTGLGLSLSYDIVKAHGGELKLETQEGKGSIFIIHIPINQK